MLLLALFLVLGYVSGSHVYEPLNTLLIEPLRGNKLPQFIQTGLFEAIKDLEQKILVLKNEQNRIPPDHFMKCSNQTTHYMNAVGRKQVCEPYMDFSRGFYMTENNFAIIIEKNSPVCISDKNLLASAKPCIFDKETRPQLASLNICEGPRWNGFKAVKDLFRHEILHALGYGTVVPSQRQHFSPKPQFYPWFDGRIYQNATRYFMDFAEEARNIVQKHFNCPVMRGVEAEGPDKIHLSEYIFGDELMTPKLSNRRNYFTLISASILENTYDGENRWYQMNYSAIHEEHSQYWFGKGWGCHFVHQSCYEYLRSPISFPFCPVHSYAQRRPAEYCMIRKGMHLRVTSPCSGLPRSLVSNRANNGITPSEIGGDPAYAPSSELYRYCPIIKHYLEEKIEPGTIFTPCN